MCECEEIRGRRSEVRERLIRAVAVAAIAASLTATITSGLTIGVSALPEVSPVSLSLAFRYWFRILEFHLSIWLVVFCIAGVVSFLRFFRWLCDHQWNIPGRLEPRSGGSA